MSASSRPLPDRERAALADLFDKLGPDAPTCCAGWTTAHLAAHLAVRDRRPDALVGFGLEKVAGGGRLADHAHRLEHRLRESTPYIDVVAQVRSGPPAWSPLGWPGGRTFNLTEFVIHHEDVRRAQPGWTPRTLSEADQDALWGPAALFALGAARRGGLVLRRTDVEGVERRIGAGGRMVAGEPLELLLWAAGRKDVARVETE
jgi:uncharacterized protein (TIGR03085 family)